MNIIKNIFLGLAIVSLTASCEKDDALDTPVITGDYQVTLPSYAMFDGEGQSFYATNKADVNGDRPFNELSDEWTWETWVKVLDGTNIDDNVLNSSVVMEQRYNFSIYIIPANSTKPEQERKIKVVDYNQPNGIGEKTILVKPDFELRFSKLENDATDVELASMSTFDNNDAVLSFDTWIHVAIVRSAATGITKFFIDGKKIGESNDPLWISKPSVAAPNWAGAYRSGYKSYMKGAQRKVRVSRVARYDDEFTPDLHTDFAVDAETVFMLNLTESEVKDENGGSPIMDVKGTYPHECKLRQSNWGFDGDVYFDE